MNLSKKLDSLRDKGRYRSLSLPNGIDLSSNDYLGLCDHEILKEAALEALDNDIALGAGGSRLLRGHCEEHHNLEGSAARHYGFEKSLFFANGFIANYALFTTLPTRNDIIVYDALLHASSLDGIHASHAKRIKVKHNDLEDFERALERAQDKPGQIYVAVEALYSMDGDFATLVNLYNLAKEYDAILVVDEAHTSGVWGPQGRGLCADLPKHNLISVHTCGKALGVGGGLICASEDVIEYMINSSRPFIYSTAPPPLQALLVEKAMALSVSQEGENRRNYLLSLCEKAQDYLGGFGSQIIPIILGSDHDALQASFKLQDNGYDVRAIRPPTVPEGTSRLRVSLNAKLTQQNLDEFCSFVTPYLLKQMA